MVWGGVSDLKSKFNLSRSYYRLQVGFGGVCRCVCGCWCFELVLDLFCLGLNSLCPTVFGYQATDSIPPQVSRKLHNYNYTDPYTDSQTARQLPNSLVPSAQPRSANLPIFTSLVLCGRGSNLGLSHLEWMR